MFEDVDFGDSLRRGDPDLWEQLFHDNIGLWMRAARRHGFHGKDAKRIIGITAAEFVEQINRGTDGRGQDMPILSENNFEEMKKKFANKVGTIARRERKEEPKPNLISIDADEDEHGLTRAIDPNPNPAESFSKVELLKQLMGLASKKCMETFERYEEAVSALNQLKTEGKLEGRITDTLIFKHIAASLAKRWRAIQKRYYTCLKKINSAAKKARTVKDGTRTLWDDLHGEM